MAGRFFITLLILGLATTASAQAISPIAVRGHIAIVGDPTTGQRVFALDQLGALHSRPVTGVGQWSPGDGPTVATPTGTAVASLFPQTGVVPVDGQPDRVIVVALPVPGALAPNNRARLWERTVAGCWTPLDAPPVGTSLLGFAPAISATVRVTRRPGTPGNPIPGTTRTTFVAVRTIDGHIWYAQYQAPTRCDPSSPPTVSWVDTRRFDHIPPAPGAFAGDVTIVSGFPGGPDIFAVTTSETLRRFQIGSSTWTEIRSPFALPPGFGGLPYEISSGGIAGVLVPRTDFNNAELRIAVGARIPESLSDRLFVARSVDGTTWGWTQLTHTPTDLGLATPFRSSLAASVRQVTFGPQDFEHVVFGDDILGDQLLPCRVPRLGPPPPIIFESVRCDEVGGLPVMGHPADMAFSFKGPFQGRDVLGPAVAGVVVPDPAFLAANPGVNPMSAPSAYLAFTPGDIAGTGYLYQMQSPSDGVQGAVWHNLLAPQSSSPVTFPSLGTAEFSGAEFFGQVALGDTGGNVVVSTDDGVTWNSVPNPFPPGPSTSDTSLSYDAQGNLWQTIIDTSTPQWGVGLARIPSGTPTGPFAPYIVIPGSNNPTTGVRDRPWMVARHDLPNFLFVTWQDISAFQGQISYCSGGISCDAAGAAWCGPYALPGQCESGGACFVTQSADGNIWIAIGNPSPLSCAPPPGMRAVGVARIGNLPALGPTCQTPTYDVVDCIFYTSQPPAGPGQQPLGLPWPSGQAVWDLRIEGAQEPGSGDVALAVRDWIDVATGLPCTSASIAQCRPDVRLLRRDSASQRWVGPTIGSPALLAPFSIPSGGAFSANGDQTMPLQWSSHILPAIAFFDYGQLDAYWMDFRTGAAPLPPASAAEYQYQYRLRQTRQDGTTVTSSSDTAWTIVPPGINYPLEYIQNNPGLYLDVDTTATAHLHTHSAHVVFNGPQGGPNFTNAAVMGLLWSPRVPPP